MESLVVNVLVRAIEGSARRGSVPCPSRWLNSTLPREKANSCAASGVRRPEAVLS